MNDIIILQKGKKGVKIRENDFGLELLITLNGFEFGQPVDDELLTMIKHGIEVYFQEKFKN